MERGSRLEPGQGWGGRGEEWARLERLLELARTAHLEVPTPEQREQIRERVLERLDRYVARRRRARFIAGASALSLGVLLLWRLVRAGRRGGSFLPSAS